MLKSFRPGELAGTLCPNSLLADGFRFDDVVGGRFAVVTSAPLTDAQRGQLNRLGAVVISATPDDDLGRWLHRGRVRGAIVRPDRYVMQTGRNLDALCAAVPAFTTPEY